MSAIVIDASVAVKWFLPEPHAHLARRVLNSRRELLAPDLIWAEVGNAIWKRCQRAELTADLAHQIVRDFRRFPLQTYEAKALLEPAWIIAGQCRINIYDGLYLALAVSHNCKLVTADRPFYDAMKTGPFAGTALWVGHVR